MFGLGMGELVVIGFIVVLMFGGTKLPKLGSSLGESIKNFKKGMKEGEAEEKKDKIDKA
jgi:sec-independent protein translocase protein TatA